jgi:hypothetical protein
MTFMKFRGFNEQAWHHLQGLGPGKEVTLSCHLKRLSLGSSETCMWLSDVMLSHGFQKNERTTIKGD